MRLVYAPLIAAALFAQTPTKVDYLEQLKNQPYLTSDNNSKYATLDQACDAATTAGVSLVVGRRWTMSTQSVTCDLVFVKGGMLVPNSGQTVTLTGTVTAPPFQIFDITAGGSVLITSGTPVIDAWYGTTSAAFYAACTAAVTARQALAVTRQWAITTSSTCAANLQFVGGRLIPATGVTVTLSGTITAPGARIFDVSASGSAVVAGSAAAIQGQVSGAWFTTPDGLADNTAGIQAAVNFFGSVGALRGGRLSLCGPYAISDTITVQAKSIEISGCGWGDQNATPKGSYLKWIRSSASTTRDMITVTCSLGLWMHDMRFIGNPAFPPQAGLGFKTQSCSGFSGATQFNRLERLAFGNYPVSDFQFFQMAYGIYTYGGNGNDDSMSLDTIVAVNTGTCLYQSYQQNVLWSVNNFGCSFSSVAGIKLAAGGTYSNLSFSGNPTDLQILRSADGQTVAPFVNIFGLSSEGSLRLLDIAPDAGTAAIFLSGATWGFGNGNTPVDDGACATGIAPYNHCSKIIRAAGIGVTIRLKNFSVLGGTSATGYQWIADFSNPAVTAYPVEVDWEGTTLEGEPVSPHILLGSAPTGSNFNEHFRLSNSTGNGNTEKWEYFGGYLIGNSPAFIPVAGVLMTPDLFPVNATCSGTCTMDLASGSIQSFRLTGNVSAWTLSNFTGGRERISITMCASGGAFTAASPTYFGGQTFGQWGFGAPIANGTCSQQMFEFTGTAAGRNNAVNAATAYRSGIAP